MREIFMIAQEAVRMYIGESWQYALFAAALLYLLFSREDKKSGRLAGGYVLAFLAVYFCPLTAEIIMDYCIGRDVYWRMLWLLPIPLVIAWAGTRFVMRFSRKIFRFCAGALLAVCIVFSGTCVYQPGVTPYKWAENINKLPTEVIDICNQINAYRGGRYARVTADYALVGYIRQYDASIMLTVGRRWGGQPQERVIAQLQSAEPDFAELARAARKLNGNYLVYPATEEQHETILSLGYEQIGNHEQYRIYYDGKKGPRIEERIREQSDSE